MNLAKIFRIAAASIFVALGFSSPSQAQVSNVYFSAGATCNAGTNTDTFVPGGTAKTFSLCMSATTATCGHTTVLKSDVAGDGLFTVTQYSASPNYPDKNSAFTLTPLTLHSTPTVADLGGTVNTDAFAPTANQLLATFTLSALSSATNSSYTLSLANTSIVAVAKNGDLKCGLTDVPDEVVMNTVGTPATFTLTRNAGPVFTSPASVTLQSGVPGSFTPVAVGVPTPTLTLLSGSVTGMSFAGGTLSGTPTVNGIYNLTFRATNSVTTTDQPFTLTVSGQASQTISFPNPGSQNFGPPITLSATGGGSGNPVTFQSNNTLVCTVSGNTLTMSQATTASTGDCSVTANQAGSATFTAATPVTVTFGITGSSPGAPTGVAVSNGNTQATVSFVAPASTGGSPITGYTATCSGVSANGTTSPITVTGLVNGQSYSCAVTATNALGTGPASAPPVTANPSAAVTLTLVGVQSRKTHGAAGVFNLPLTTGLPITDSAITVEPRGALVSNLADHSIVFQFSGPVSVAGTAVSVDGVGAPVGTVGTPVASGNEVIVPLTAVLNQKRAMITLSGVSGPSGATTGVITMGFLSGDVASPYGDTSALGDILQVKLGAKVGVTNSSNFLTDLNIDGTIGLGDILAAKLRNGKSLP